MDTGYAESGGIAEEIAGGLRAGEADEKADGRERRRLAGGGEGKAKRGGFGEIGGSGSVKTEEGGGAQGAVDEAGDEGVAGGAAQHLEDVLCARV
jgi:hypothetical protein